MKKKKQKNKIKKIKKDMVLSEQKQKHKKKRTDIISALCYRRTLLGEKDDV